MEEALGSGTEKKTMILATPKEKQEIASYPRGVRGQDKEDFKMEQLSFFKSQCTPGWGARCARGKSKKSSCRCECGGINHGVSTCGVSMSKSKHDITDTRIFSKPLTYHFKPKYPEEDLVFERMHGNVFTNVDRVLTYHSPDGFEWGYGGSGPADLALNCLARFIPTQDAWNLHQEFKWKFIATLPEEGGVIKSKEVICWIKEQFEKEQRGENL